MYILRPACFQRWNVFHVPKVTMDESQIWMAKFASRVEAEFFIALLEGKYKRVSDDNNSKNNS